MTEVDFRFTEGAAYERFMGPWTRAAGAVFLDWLAAPAGLRWLDVGCGTGAFTELLLERALPGAVIAIDPAPAQIAHAQDKPAARQADFRVADAESLPFADACFDVVVSALVLNFIPDRQQALAEMRRVTRPGGRVAAYVWDFCGPLAVTRPFANVLREMQAKVAPVPGVKSTRLEALEEMFAAAGLSAVASRSFDVTRTYANFDDYWRRFLDNPSPASQFVRDLSPAAQAAFRARVSASLPAASDGKITFAARANAVKGLVGG